MGWEILDFLFLYFFLFFSDEEKKIWDGLGWALF